MYRSVNDGSSYCEIEALTTTVGMPVMIEERLCWLIESQGQPFVAGWWHLLGENVIEFLLTKDTNECVIPFPIIKGGHFHARIDQSEHGWGIYIGIQELRRGYYETCDFLEHLWGGDK